MEQATFKSLTWSLKDKITRRERFLAEMDAVIPGQALTKLIRPHYPKAGNGTQPMPLERMLRIHFMQRWFNLSDPGMEDALCDAGSMSRFAAIELAEEAARDESTIMRLRRLLEQHKLSQKSFGEVRTLLEDKRLVLKSGTVVGATIIETPISTKNADGERDREMHQVVKGKEWHFGMKPHVGADLRGIVHTLTTTGANVADINEMPKLLREPRKRLSAIRHTGANGIGKGPRLRGFGIESTAAAPARCHSRNIGSSLTDCARERVHDVSTPSAWSNICGASICGASPRCSTEVWRRTRSRFPTCICCGDGCSHCRRGARRDRRGGGKPVPKRAKCAPTDLGLGFLMSLIMLLIRTWARIATCAECP